MLLLAAASSFTACDDELVFGKDYVKTTPDEPEIEVDKITSRVFEAGKDNHIYFRIPALIETKSGILLAFCEARNTKADFYEGNESRFPCTPVGSASNKDIGDIDLVMKASRDGGQTWLPMVTIADDFDNTCGNPCPVVDESTSRIHLFWCWSKFGADSRLVPSITDNHSRRVMYCYSDNDGETWSEPQDLTSTLKKDDWSWYATGPCHAIQVRTGAYKGRLVIPCNHRDNNNKDNYSHCVYSDDNGKTWILGGSTRIGGNESCITELSDGTLMTNVRTVGLSSPNRASAISTDGGSSWSDWTSHEELLDPGCQGSVINFMDKGTPTSTLVLSNCHYGSRSNLCLSRSTDNGRTWSTEYVVWKDRAAYSDICLMVDGSLAVMYEAGYGMFGKPNPNEMINFMRIADSSVDAALGLK